MSVNTGSESAVAAIRAVLDEATTGAIDAQEIATDADLFAAGLTSHQAVQVMLGLEDHFDIELPDELMVGATFSSIDSIRAAVASVAEAD